MLYGLTLSFDKEQSLYLNEEHSYYAILGAILMLFENNENIYNSIIKLSFHNQGEIFKVMISINSENAYNKAIDLLLANKTAQISLNGKTMQLKNLKIEFKIFNPDSIEIREFSKFQIRFLSPTFIRHENILYTLPNPDQFIFSSFEKITSLIGEGIDKEAFKQWLKFGIYIGEYQLRTKLITIKKNKKCGCQGYAQYYINPDFIEGNESFIKTLYLCLKAMPFVGMGSGTKLGCGNVAVFIS